MSLHFSSNAFRLLLVAVLLATLSSASCSGKQPKLPDNAAGSGAEPLPEKVGLCGSEEEAPAPPLADCLDAAAGKVPLIDDFEDGDVLIDLEEGRSGQWFVYTDGTDGCVEAQAESSSGSVALAVRGEGFSNWGAGFGVNLDWSLDEQGACLYDASAYQGIRLRARGNAPVRVVFPEKSSTFESLGGECPDAEGCYDRHGRTLALSEDWQQFELDFCALSQEGWGTPLSAFSPGEMLGVSFNVRSTQPFEIWIDDLEFIPKTAGTNAACGTVCPLQQLPSGIPYDPETTPKEGGIVGLALHTFQQETPDCGPLLRRYLSYVPPSLEARTEAPVVLLLPGTSSDAESMHSFMTQGRFVELAEEDDFVLVYANAAPGPYTAPERPNGGRFWLTPEENPQVDDRQYLKMIVEDLTAEGLISGENPLFLVGHSIGGGLALEAALEDPDRYVGIAPIMPFDGNPPPFPEEQTSFALKRILFAYTHDDPDLPTGYEDVLKPLFDRWTEVLGISLDDPQTTLRDDLVREGEDYQGKDPTALRTRDSRVTQIDFGPADGQRRVRVFEFDRAGHFWPTSNPYEDEALLSSFGFRNRDIDLSAEVWEFFESAL